MRKLVKLIALNSSYLPVQRGSSFFYYLKFFLLSDCLLRRMSSAFPGSATWDIFVLFLLLFFRILIISCKSYFLQSKRCICDLLNDDVFFSRRLLGCSTAVLRYVATNIIENLSDTLILWGH